MNKTVLSLMTQMRNITTAAMFATANGHVGSGASVADNFRISGLGQLIEAGIQAERLITFGD